MSLSCSFFIHRPAVSPNSSFKSPNLFSGDNPNPLFIVPHPHRDDDTPTTLREERCGACNAFAGNPSSGTPNPPSAVTLSGGDSLRLLAVANPPSMLHLPLLQTPNPFPFFAASSSQQVAASSSLVPSRRAPSSSIVEPRSAVVIQRLSLTGSHRVFLHSSLHSATLCLHHQE
ncbi:uncharacterized protein DS421_15g500160 [Arachis hypogaea]|nr:uncharacterized protein DS421_15g500160 [Arachis hypogaea]